MSNKTRSLSFALTALLIAGVASESRAGFNVQIDFNDAGGANAAYYDRITDAMEAAADAWSRYVATQSVTLKINLKFTNEATASAGSASSRYVGTTGSLSTYELGTIVKLTTGTDINGASADANFNIGHDWLTNTLFWNPTPGSGPIPSDKVDSHYAFMHELGHILGFISYRDAGGNLPVDGMGRTLQFTYDALTTVAGSDIFMEGAGAKAGNGGDPVALTRGNFSHVGNSSGAGSHLVSDVMNGVVSKRGFLYELSGVDVGILEDLGYQLTAEGRALVYGSTPPAVPEPASVIAMVAGLAGVGVWRIGATRRRRAA